VKWLSWSGIAMVATTVTLVSAMAMATEMANGDVYAIGKAETPLPLPVTVNGRAAPSFERASWARAMLRRHGLRDIRGLSRVGDYWEAEARSGGQQIVVYLINNGMLLIRHYSHGAIAAAFGGWDKYIVPVRQQGRN
jgi:hypothetical protein